MTTARTSPRAAPSAPVAGDDAALQLFVEEMAFIHRSLRRLGIHARDVEDVAHEVFLVVLEKRDKFDPARPRRPWLFAIAYREALNHRRRRREVLDVDVDLDVIDERSSPLHATELAERRAVALAAIHEIPVRARAVFILHVLEEMDMRDVAKALGIPRFTAYSRLRKAREVFARASERLTNRPREAKR